MASGPFQDKAFPVAVDAGDEDAGGLPASPLDGERNKKTITTQQQNTEFLEYMCFMKDSLKNG